MLPLLSEPPAFYGPLPVKYQTSLSGVATLLEPEQARVLLRGQREQRLRLDIGNNTIYHGTLSRFIYDDSEVQNLRLGESYGASWGDWSWQASLVQRSGGFLDPLVKFWHDNVVPFNDPLFSTLPGGQARLAIKDTDPLLERNGTAVALSNVTLTARRALRPGLTARVVVKVPVAGRGQFLDNSAVDLGVGLLGQTQLTPRWSLHGNLNLVRQGTTRVGELSGGSRWLIGSVFAAEFRTTNRTTLVVQSEDTTFPFLHDLRGGSSRRTQMSFGAWHEAAPGTLWHAAFSENITPFHTTSYTPDVMISLGVTRRH
ncbi:hypothetical protein [Armatimonas sp.]|uniref:hypothetical protein n=1 Tax=Armatimonas sp. TaxID=1872638 RepID=UPI00286C5F6A|nr:hypothetical protein [Armatimonas sp.]